MATGFGLTQPIGARAQATFGALVIAQATHSAEEYFGRLWESFPPAAFLTGLVAADREVGFLLLNGALIAFGAWCFLRPVRLGWPSAVPLMWGWSALEFINGIGHPLWSLRQGGYTPGVGTAPVLLALSIGLAVQLRIRSSAHAPAGRSYSGRKPGQPHATGSIPAEENQN